MKVHVGIEVEMCRVQSRKRKYSCKNEIIQIVAVMMDDNYEIIDKYSTYVQPRYGKIDHFIVSLTGISERTIKDAPDIEEALNEMLEWIGDKDVTFYSWSPTDYFQIRKEIHRKCQSDVRWTVLLEQDRWIDYQRQFGERLDSPRLLKLTEALDLAEIDTKGHLHDGLDDAYNTACMISKLEKNKDYQTLLERARVREREQKPLTITLGSLMQGLIIESA